MRVLSLLVGLFLAFSVFPAQAQTLNTSDFQIEWKVSNRFRLFSDESFFKRHESAWNQYLIHVGEQAISEDQKQLLVEAAS